MFEDFQRRRIDAGGIGINLVVGGSGPPLLLLHGYPQTHVMWHKVAPRLAERFTVVAADLRGYGDSDKPDSGPPHAAYSKRQSAADQVAVMEALGFRRFALVGHDRGGRVGHRMALDHPGRVERLAVLDIAPTRAMYAGTTKSFATAYYHWFFLIQPAPLPETLIGRDPAWFLRASFGRLGQVEGAFTEEAMAEYVRCFSHPAAIHASCEDYRAAATIDLEHDESDLDRKVECPLLALWGARGVVEREFDVAALWRERAGRVETARLDCGHYLPEEDPEGTLAALLPFLGCRPG